MKRRIPLRLPMAGIVCAMFPLLTANAQVPNNFHYQGQLTANGAPIDGAGSFKFALVDSGTENVTTATAVANVTDGLVTSISVIDGGSGYVQAPKVTIEDSTGSKATAEAKVENGEVVEIIRTNPGEGYTTSATVVISAPPSASMQTLWSNDGTSSGGSEPSAAVALEVREGVFSVALGGEGMEAITHEIINEGPLFLRIWSDGGSGFNQLAPDQPLTSVPTALLAKSAVRAESVADGVIGSTQIDSGIGLWTNSAGSFTTGNHVGIGTNSPSQALDVNGNIEVSGWMGTAQNQPLELRAADQAVIRIDPRYFNDDFRPNVIIGAASNQIPGSTTRGATISGGRENTVSGNDSTIGGGLANTASSFLSTIGGGEFNEATGSRSTVGGGRGNVASSLYSTVGGGIDNEASGSRATVAGGDKNVASGSRATVGGGLENTASGTAATVPGGIDNIASGNYSFAAGQLANAAHNGAFVWGGGGGFASTGQNQFLIRADGGVGIGTNNPEAALHVNGDTAVGGFSEDYRLGVGTSNPWNTLHVVSNDDQGPFRVAVGSNTNTAFRIYPNRGAGIGDSWSESSVPERGLRVFGESVFGSTIAVNTTNPRAETLLHLKNKGNLTPSLILEEATTGVTWGMTVGFPSRRLYFQHADDAVSELERVSYISPGGGYSRFSDRRLKQNIQSLDGLLGRVLELEPVSYQMTHAGDDSELEYGFIAQDVREVFPKMVHDEEESEHLGLSYDSFSVVAIQAIQEQQAIIESQAGQIEELEGRLARIETLLEGKGADTIESR